MRPKIICTICEIDFMPYTAYHFIHDNEAAFI